MPKASVSPDFKRPTFNPALYAGPSGHRAGETTPRRTPVRRSRKSLREIKPRLEESARHSKTSNVSVGCCCFWGGRYCSPTAFLASLRLIFFLSSLQLLFSASQSNVWQGNRVRTVFEGL